MKTKIIMMTLLLLIGMAEVSFAQPGKRGEQAAEKLAALRKAYITDKLALTDKESEAFWPVYSEYKRKEKSINKKMKSRDKKTFDEMTEQEAREFVERRLAIEQEKLSLKKEYFSKMGEVIPMKKFVRLPRAEKSFRAEVMKRMKKRRQQMQQRPGGKRPGGK